MIGSRIVLSTRIRHGSSMGQRNEREGTVKDLLQYTIEAI